MDAKTARYLLSLSLLFMLAGCNTIEGTGSGHRNPAFVDYKAAEIAIDVRPRSDLADLVEAKLVMALASHGVSSFKTSEITRFARDDGDALNQMAEQGAHGVLLVQLDDSVTVAVHGMQTYGTVSGNQYQATAVPVASTIRRVDASIHLYSTRPGFQGLDLAVEGSAIRAASEPLYTGNESMAASVAEGVIEALAQARVLP